MQPASPAPDPPTFYLEYDGSAATFSISPAARSKTPGQQLPPVINIYPGATLNGPTPFLQTLAGGDTVTVSGGTVVGVLDTGADVDDVTIGGGTLGGVQLGTGADQFTMTDGLLNEIPGLAEGRGFADAGAGNDVIDFSGGVVEGGLDGGAGDDAITVSGGTVGRRPVTAAIPSSAGPETTRSQSPTATFSASPRRRRRGGAGQRHDRHFRRHDRRLGI